MIGLGINEKHGVIGRESGAEHHAAKQVYAIDHSFSMEHLSARKPHWLRMKIVDGVGI